MRMTLPLILAWTLAGCLPDRPADVLREVAVEKTEQPDTFVDITPAVPSAPPSMHGRGRTASIPTGTSSRPGNLRRIFDVWFGPVVTAIYSGVLLIYLPAGNRFLMKRLTRWQKDRSPAGEP